jgi:hypothetical protein
MNLQILPGGVTKTCLQDPCLNLPHLSSAGPVAGFFVVIMNAAAVDICGVSMWTQVSSLLAMSRRGSLVIWQFHIYPFE